MRHDAKHSEIPCQECGEPLIETNDPKWPLHCEFCHFDYDDQYKVQMTQEADDGQI